jgi:hypothetical protein
VPFGAAVFVATLLALSREAALEMLSLARNFASSER